MTQYNMLCVFCVLSLPIQISAAQRLLRIHAKISKAQRESKTLDYMDVKDELLRSKPQCKGALPSMWKFCMRFGGEGLWIRGLADWVADNGSTRQLGPEWFESLSQDIKPASAQQLPFLRQKLLSAGYMAPGLTIQNVKSIVFGKDMAETRANLCEVFQTLKKLINAHAYHNPTAMHQLQSATELDAILAAAGKHQNANVTDPRQCALQFVDVAEELIKKRLTDKYDSFVVTAAPSSASSAKPGAKGKPQEIMVPRTFDEQGQLPWHEVLKELGYEVSSHVERKKDKTIACIEEIVGDKVILVVDESVMAGGKCQVSANSFTAGEWKVVKEPKAPELAKVILPQDWKELRHLYAKGALIKQLLDMQKKDEVSSVPSQLLLYQKPQLGMIGNLLFVQFLRPASHGRRLIYFGCYCVFMYAAPQLSMPLIMQGRWLSAKPSSRPTRLCSFHARTRLKSSAKRMITARSIHQLCMWMGRMCCPKVSLII